MARPRLEPGTHGQISVTNFGPGDWEARVRYRDLHGELRHASATGYTRAEATKLLLDRLDGLGGSHTQEATGSLPESSSETGRRD
jgi:hypothetical protein